MAMFLQVFPPANIAADECGRSIESDYWNTSAEYPDIHLIADLVPRKDIVRI
jgi:hypothetical protein